MREAGSRRSRFVCTARSDDHRRGSDRCHDCLALGASVPTGEDELRAMVGRYVERGITKFVLIPAGVPRSWDEELRWLSPQVHAIEA